MNSTKLREGRFVLALVLISAAFVIIGAMLWIQHETTSEIRQEIKNIINSNLPNNKTTTLISGLEETDKSNQNTFNILLPVFAAWITTVVAFYFHAQTQDQSNKTIQDLSKKITGGLSDMTISEIMSHYPDCRNIEKVNLESSMADVKTKCNRFGNIVVVGDHDNPLGILYSKDIQAASDNSKLNENIHGIQDNITNAMWTEEGVENFANLTPEDKVPAAINKMDSIKKDDPTLRGLVFEKGKMIGIVNYQMLTKPLI